MLEHATGTVSFFQASAPVLIANVLTVAFVLKNSSEGAYRRRRGSPYLPVADHSRLLVSGSSVPG